MDNYSIKSVTFGGFDKQDVVRYIEETAQQNASARQALEEEIHSLREKESRLSQEVSTLRSQLDSVIVQRDSLQETLAQETAVRQSLEPLKSLETEVIRLQAEIDALRPDAEAYAQFRERIGAIECEARKRADDLENATAVQLEKTMVLFREQYQTLMHTFESTANHVTSELRKIEVNLTQLPRAMDQTGVELNELAARLKQEKK